MISNVLTVLKSKTTTRAALIFRSLARLMRKIEAALLVFDLRLYCVIVDVSTLNVVVLKLFPKSSFCHT